MLLCSKKEAKNPLEIDAKKFTKRSDILKSFFSNKNLQPDILYAVQYLDHRIQHSSKNLMHAIFKLLYDEKIIRGTKRYYKWRDEEYEAGHSIAVESAESFFNWLLDKSKETRQGKPLSYKDPEDDEQNEEIYNKVESNPKETENLNENLTVKFPF